MFQARSLIPWSLLIAGPAFAVIVKLPVAAQEPQKPADVERNVVVKAHDDGAGTVFKKIEELVSKKPVELGPVDDELRGLLLARRDAAMRRLRVLLGFFEEGRITADKYLDGIYGVLDAQRELTNNPAEHVPILELRLTLAKEVEAREAAEVVVGRGNAADVEEAVCGRLAVEIDLLRTKRKLVKK
jgi:hypothetical protein